jgi:AraC-like DNA-binding protein
MRPVAEHRNYRNALPVNCWEGERFDFMAHWHPEVELFLVREGTMQVGINGETRGLGPGSLAVCGSNDIHHYRKTAEGGRHILLIFRPELAGYPGIWPAGRRLASHFCPPELAARLAPLLEGLVAEQRQADEFHAPVSRGLLMQLCGLLDRHLCTAADPAAEAQGRHWRERMGKAIEFIRSHSRRDLRLEEVAAAVNISPCHFSRNFAASTGQRFTAYLNAVRLEEAEGLLAEGGRRMVDIALDCGFGSVRSFNRAWLEQRGAPPRRTASRARDGKGAERSPADPPGAGGDGTPGQPDP